jgi:hypothetical protein
VLNSIQQETLLSISPKPNVQPVINLDPSTQSLIGATHPSNNFLLLPINSGKGYKIGMIGWIRAKSENAP